MNKGPHGLVTLGLRLGKVPTDLLLGDLEWVKATRT